MRESVRALRATEGALLAEATLGNVNWSGPRFTAAQVRQEPALAHYFANWPGEHDFGVVAERDGAPVGVCWLRRFSAADPGYGFVDEEVPELSLWVAAGHRGRGIGTRLLGAAIEQARSREVRGISLSVERGNPSRRLYERAGFVAAGSHDAGTLLLRL